MSIKTLKVRQAVHQRRFGSLPGAANAWAIAELSEKHQKLVIISPSRQSAEELYNNLCFFVPNWKLTHLPAWDPLPFELVSPQIETSAARCLALNKLLKAQSFILVTSVEALYQKILSPTLLLEAQTDIKRGATLTLQEVSQYLTLARYSKVSLVEDIGDCAIHGNVIDFYTPQLAQPVRLEFKENKVHEIRTFDKESQRSISNLGIVSILPVREYCLTGDAQGLEGRIQNLAKKREAPLREASELLDALKNNPAPLPGIELFQTLVHGAEAFVPLHSLFQDCSIALDNPEASLSKAEEFYELIEEKDYRAQQENRLVPLKSALFINDQACKEILKAPENISLNTFDRTIQLNDDGDAKSTRAYNAQIESNTALATRLKTKVGTGDAFSPLKEYVERLRKQGYRLCFVVGSDGRAERLYEILLRLNLEAKIEPRNTPILSWMHTESAYPLIITEGQLSIGFQIHTEKTAFIAEAEIFAERSHRKKRSAKTNIKKLLGALAQLSEQDLVVHADYGIGRYQGLKHLEVQGVESDFLDIVYADSRLFLPIQNISKIQKYTASEGAQPELDKLRSPRWLKTKQRVKQAVIPLAGELIKLYAARSVAKGWRYEPIGAEDERFADLFAFEETNDQSKAINETLTDMASDKPMDRLVCGDVGFGKTEVAIRAAFKCIQHQRQVAVLVPTTILVEQHLNNFRNRFNDYPVTVSGVSRFFDPSKNQKTLQQVADGTVDIIIGTHRLLSKDVSFKDLGLVIIDEEHRFGVKQKEKLKQLKQAVDVLTLTATPIPRTLHLSLLGIRDISVISTPPQDRKVIRTYVAGYEDGIVRDAIMREIQRGGQAFYLHNRVQSIALVTETLRALVPEARFEYAHGQMSEQQLETIMHRFIAHEIDVLISTTIIESGLDVPNANTMIVDRADSFGLAQLYQIRGRVGRSTRQAYCYFMVPRSMKLTKDAAARLKALQALDDLGLGFNLAMRDMEIRGAGNLLGKEQSGNVLAVGFDLYCSILQEAVQHLKGEESDSDLSIEPEVKIAVDAYIPETYIPDVGERLVLYQRLASVRDDAEMDELALEIEDRYGNFGVEVQELIQMMRFRCFLKTYRCVRAELSAQKMLFSFTPNAPIDGARIIKLMRSKPDVYKLG